MHIPLLFDRLSLPTPSEVAMSSLSSMKKFSYFHYVPLKLHTLLIVIESYPCSSSAASSSCVLSPITTCCFAPRDTMHPSILSQYSQVSDRLDPCRLRHHDIQAKHQHEPYQFFPLKHSGFELNYSLTHRHSSSPSKSDHHQVDPSPKSSGYNPPHISTRGSISSSPACH